MSDVTVGLSSRSTMVTGPDMAKEEATICLLVLLVLPSVYLIEEE